MEQKNKNRGTSETVRDFQSNSLFEIATQSIAEGEGEIKMSDLASMLLGILSHKPVSKEYLRTTLNISFKVDVSDRMLRKAAAELRENGYPVCSNSDVRGYWLGDKSDVERTVKEYEHRAMADLKTAHAMKQGPKDDQYSWEV